MKRSLRDKFLHFIYIVALLSRYIGCPKIKRFEFAVIFASSCWQAWEKNSLTAESLGLVNMERYTIQQRIFIIE